MCFTHCNPFVASETLETLLIRRRFFLRQLPVNARPMHSKQTRRLGDISTGLI